MFTNRKDPLIDAVKSVMSEGNLKRQVEEAVNNHFGVSSRKAIPHEHLAEYDSLLAEAYKCAMEEEKDYSGDYHVVSPDGYTVLISNMEKGAQESAQKFGKGYKVYRGNQLPKDWKGSGTGSENFAGQRIKEEKSISHPNQKIISKQDGKPESISGEDLDILRKKKKAGIAIKQEETQLDEKATEAQKEKVAKVMHKWKQGKEHIGKSKETVPVTKKGQKQAVAIALSQAGLSKKKQMDESVESIMEEIRVNLEEQLMEAYATGDSEVFEDFVLSLNEEQLELLGLNEDWRGALAQTGGFDFGGGYQTPSRVAAAQSRGAARTATRPSAPAARPSAPSAASTARPAAPTGTAARPTPAATQAKPETSNVPSESGYGRSNLPINQPKVAPGTPPKYVPPEERGPQTSNEPNVERTLAPQPALKPGQAGPMPRSFDTTPKSFEGPKPGTFDASRAKPTQPLSKPGEFKPQVTPLEKQSGEETDKAQKAAFGESTHIRESLESFIRNKFIKG